MVATNKTPYFNDNDDVVFTKAQVVPVGSPLRIEGRQGLWRYTARAGSYVEVVGPYFPTKRNSERSRIFPVEQLKYPGKKYTSADVVSSPEATAISQQAKRGKRT